MVNRRKLILGLVSLGTLIGSLLLAFGVIGHDLRSTRAQQASGVTLQEFYIPGSSDPWGTAFDSSGNVWLAIPGCDPSPTCSSNTPPGEIAVFNPANATWIKTYQLPSGYAQPLFLAFDAQGNVWFAMPMDNALGMLNPATNTFQQWAVPTANAGPWDVAIDHQGKIWFTEHYTNQIGRFDPTTHTFLEVATPASNSQPYGITVDAANNVWFAENNSSVALIGEYTSGGQLQEYKIRTTSSSGLTPHMLTVDPNGNIWWTEGWTGMIGKLTIAQAVPGTNNGVTEYAYTPPCTTCGGEHTSGISVDSNGLIWFDDSLQDIVGSFPESGSGSFSLYTVPTSNGHPHDGLNVDGQNRIWFDEEFANKLAEAVQNIVPTPTPTSGSSPTPTNTVLPSPTPTLSPTATTTSTLPPGPVNPTWYFAEGKVGQGFTEWLTIQNPDPVNVCNVSIQYLLASGSPVNRSVNVLPNTRATESVNADLHTPANATTYRAVSTLVSVTNTPTCRGVVAERPLYFLNFKGVSSGTDSLGATHLGTDYYFADVSSLPGYNSYLTILNPPGSSAATVTASYYLKGLVQGTDTLVVQPGTRGTIIPRHFGTRVATWVHASTPVVVERPAYFANYSSGNALHVTGSASVVGAPAPSTDWRFAEGYIGTGFQENLVLANFGTSPASATVVLEYDTGATLTHVYPIPAQEQVIVDVNAATATHVGTCAPSCALSTAVSAEITTPAGTPIVAERELFFHYTHSANGRQVLAMGGTDVTGQAGTAVPTAYSFAEGYTNRGYDEWLTLQNPGTTPETIWVTLSNGKGTVYAFPVQVGPHTRSTTDIVAVVSQHVYHQGDGYLGYEVSMTVQTTDGSGFVAERPMYWNVAGSQGGDDILGYVGN